MKLHPHQSRQPKQRAIVRALAVALAVASGASGAFAARENTSIPAETLSLQKMTPSQKASLYQDWRASRRSESEKTEIEALIEAWRQRHSAPKTQLKALPEPQATIVVQNCNDAGAGSLRAAVASAANSDTIDLTQLACSTITLTTGAIVIGQNNLNIVGPGAGELAISGNNQSQVLVHTGTGSLSIDDVTVRDGFKYSNADSAYGGCVFSNGSVSISNAEINGCTALTIDPAGSALGGAIFAIGDISVTSSLVSGNAAANKYDGQAPLAAGNGGGLFTEDGEVGVLDSLITDNIAYSTNSNSLAALGGGVFSGNGIQAKYSQFTHNEAGDGGGLSVRRDVVIAHSTISNNHAIGFGAARFHGQSDQNPNPSFSMRNSTVSGNSAELCGGMGIGNFDQVWISSSTIARNSAVTDINNCGSGIGIPLQVNELRFESTIIAENTAGGNPSDLKSVQMVPAIIGANNLIFQSSLALPPGTITQTSPVLGPLAFNGGSTRTHALLAGSPALNAGNNVFNLINEQRGTGFPRVFGPQADIGAFEVQEDFPPPADLIFYNGFGFDEEFGGPGG